MAKWKGLPYEIKLEVGRILFKIYKNDLPDQIPKSYLWRFVNREMYYIYLYHYYDKERVFDFRSDDNNKIEKIIHSPFNNGAWIKSIESLWLKVPDNSLADIDLASDKLYQFMDRCPNVLEVSNVNRDIKAWIYFTYILLQNKTWNLQSLPACNLNSDEAPYYFLCAYRMRNSLISLSLTEGIISKTLDLLRSSATVAVDDAIIQDLTNCSAIMKIFPNLRMLKMNTFLDLFNIHSNNGNMDLDVYKNVEYLELVRYKPTTSTELLQLTTTLPCVKNASIYNNNSKTTDNTMIWPMQITTSVSTLVSFFEYLMKMSSYHLCMPVASSIYFVLDQFYAAYKLRNCKSRLSINLETHSIYAPRQEHGIINFTKDRDGDTIRLRVDLHYQNPDSMLIDIFRNLDENVETVRMMGSERCKTEIGVCIDNLLSRTSNAELKKIEIHGGHLSTYSNSHIHPRTQNIQELRLGLDICSPDALSLLSKDFPYVEKLQLDNPTALPHNNTLLNIFMENTVVDKLIIRHVTVNYYAKVLLSITSLEENMTKYVVNSRRGGAFNQAEITKQQFDAMDGNLFYMTIRLKSMNSFEFGGFCYVQNDIYSRDFRINCNPRFNATPIQYTRCDEDYDY